MARTVADDAVSAEPVDIDPFRRRLLDGLAASIGERGYRASTVADIVRHARTSKRTFYGHFPSKEQCFLELLHADVENLADGDSRRRRSGCGLAGPDSSGRGGLRRSHRGQTGHHVELDSRNAIIGRGGAALPASGPAVIRPACWSISAAARGSRRSACRR